MIINVSGDILLSDAQAIAHGIAPGDHFNQGLALALRESFPAMAKDFRHYCHQESPKAGTVWMWAGPDRVIVNLLTQEPARDEKSNPGKAEEKHINHALKELRDLIDSEGIESVALPRLATGVGGMEWPVVQALIEKHLGDLDIPVIVYETYLKGQKAPENLSGQCGGMCACQ